MMADPLVKCELCGKRMETAPGPVCSVCGRRIEPVLGLSWVHQDRPIRGHAAAPEVISHEH